MVDPFERRKKDIGADILDTAAAVMPHAARLACVEAVRELADGVRRRYSDAGWLRSQLAASGSLPDVVREASALWTRSPL
jgi:gamma-glutamyl:cysteine ligase YbdK (ATP-grasp superfamily)